MAISTIGLSAVSDCPEGGQERIIHALNGHMYCFQIAPGGGITILQSKDGGKTWPYALTDGTATLSRFSVWYDRWTPGLTTHMIHYWAIDVTNHDIIYNGLDLIDGSSDYTLVTDIGYGFSPQVVFNGASLLSSGANISLSGSISRGGTLMVAFDGDGGTEKGFYRVTAGSLGSYTWTSKSDPTEGSDYFQLYPGFAADNNDMLMIFWDRSADELSRKIYDDSANSWAETSIATSMVDQFNTTTGPQFMGSVRHSDSKLIVAAWTNRDVATADLKCWVIDEAAITAVTDIVTDADDCHNVGLMIDRNNDFIYAFFIGKSDGSEVISTAAGVYFKVSTDGGTTWSADRQLDPVRSGLTRAALWCDKGRAGITPMVVTSSIIMSPLTATFSPDIAPTYQLGVA